MATPYKMKNSMLKMTAKGAPMQKNYAGPLRKEGELNDLVAKRDKLRSNEKKLNDGKVKVFGNVRRKINEKKQEKNQAEINANTTAQKNATKGANKKKIDAVTKVGPGPEYNPTKEKNEETKKPQGRRQS